MLDIDFEELKALAIKKGVYEKCFFDEDKPITGVAVNRLIQAYTILFELRDEIENKKEKSPTLPSRYKHGEKVKHILIDETKVVETKVIKIHFTESAISYDIELKMPWPEHQTPKPGFEKKGNFCYTRLYNVESSYLSPVTE